MTGAPLVLTNLPGAAGVRVEKQPPAATGPVTLQYSKHLWMNFSCPHITKHFKLKQGI